MQGITTIALLLLSGGAMVTGLWLSRRLLQAKSLPLLQWQDPRYRFRSLVELHHATQQGYRFDVSTATVDDWLRLPLFSIHQARLLVQLQRSGVVFHCLEDVAAALDWTPAQIAPLGAVLRFTYYEANSPLTIPRLNVNTAECTSLVKVPGLDAGLVERLLSDRQAHGKYRHLADLQRRLNLSGDLVADLMHYLTFH